MNPKATKIDNTRNQRQARRREREKQWLTHNGWRSWEALHTSLINGSTLLILWRIGDRIMKKISVSIDGKKNEDLEIFEGYTDNSLPSPHIALTKEEASKFLSSTPYDFRFMKEGEIPFLRIYRGERYEDILPASFPTDDGNIFEGYFLDGFDLAEIE
jgi:hypothetical protein